MATRGRVRQLRIRYTMLCCPPRRVRRGCVLHGSCALTADEPACQAASLPRGPALRREGGAGGARDCGGAYCAAARSLVQCLSCPGGRGGATALECRQACSNGTSRQKCNTVDSCESCESCQYKPTRQLLTAGPGAASCMWRTPAHATECRYQGCTLPNTGHKHYRTVHAQDTASGANALGAADPSLLTAKLSAAAAGFAVSRKLSRRMITSSFNGLVSPFRSPADRTASPSLRAAACHNSLPDRNPCVHAPRIPFKIYSCCTRCHFTAVSFSRALSPVQGSRSAARTHTHDGPMPDHTNRCQARAPTGRPT